MSETYELFRLSLIESRQKSLFEAGISREDHIRRVFSRRWEFTHYKTPFYYVPAKPSEYGKTDFALGLIGRSVIVPENLPPEKGLAESTHEGWRAIVIVVDPADAGDGQKISVERNLPIATPRPLLRSFLKAVNTEFGEIPFRIEAQPIFDAASFWSFAAHNRGDIVRLTFDFVVPNGLWSTRTNIHAELKEAHETMRAQEVSTTLKSHAGLNTDAAPVKEAVEYAEKGSGSIKAKTRAGKTFSSETRAKTVTIFQEASSKFRSKLARAALNVARILDNE